MRMGSADVDVQINLERKNPEYLCSSRIVLQGLVVGLTQRLWLYKNGRFITIIQVDSINIINIKGSRQILISRQQLQQPRWTTDFPWLLREKLASGEESMRTPPWWQQRQQLQQLLQSLPAWLGKARPGVWHSADTDISENLSLVRVRRRW